MMKYLFVILIVAYSNLLFAEKYTVADASQLDEILGRLQPGDMVIWKNGTYKDVAINFKPSKAGSEHNPIILMAETPGKVKFEGASYLVLNGTYLQASGFLFEGKSTLQKKDVITFHSNSSYCRITNCAVKNYSPDDVMVNNNWISVQGRYNELDHCSFLGKTNQGPYLVVRYKTDDSFVEGSDQAPSTFHHIHHNYFGYRTLSTDNGGEDMRIGDSKTSFTHGFNIIEYNYFEEHRLEPEVISNKSWNNIYRFNTFISNDGAMVLRHGQQCFVYGNYFNGKNGRKMSGGLRIINPNQTVFNNYLQDLEGGANDMKSPITIMAGLVGSKLNEYYPADNALVAFNTVVGSVGPVIAVGIGNKSKGKAFVAPKNVSLISNLIIDTKGANTSALVESEDPTFLICENNKYTNGQKVSRTGFSMINSNEIVHKDGFNFCKIGKVKEVVDSINQRLEKHHIKLSEKEITQFNPKWKLNKNDVGAEWFKL